MSKYRVVWKEEEKRIVKKSSNYVSLEEAKKLHLKLKSDKTNLPVWIEDENCNVYDDKAVKNEPDTV